MPTPLSSHPSQLRSAYGVVVVGSGYGGSITAARLSERGHDVCVLERGKEWLVGRFPDDPLELQQEVRSEHNPNGLYDYHVGHDIDVFSGSGLGGTSLINANVAIRPDAKVFAQPRWPKAIQEASHDGSLDVFFDRAEKTLGVEESRPRQGDPKMPKKVQAQRQSAEALGKDIRRLKIAVNHDAEGPNPQGVPVAPCTYCGDCITGCNVGAKKTLPMNYLPIARSHGAEIYCQVEVRFVLEAADGGYFVFCTYRPEGHSAVEKVVYARAVVLGAGALGSTGILLRSRERGLSTGRCVGHHFGSNGDQLGIGYNNDVRCDSYGFGARPEKKQPVAVGPTIMSVIDFRNDEDKRYIVEEGAIPRALVDALRGVTAKLAFLDGSDTDGGFVDELTETGRILRDKFTSSREGALNHSMIYLGMGDDDADGRVDLDPDGKARIIWGSAGHKPIFEQLSTQMRDLVVPLGGTYVENPRFWKAAGRNPVTVHPLGGCPMGDDETTGAVDHAGRVFRADGSVHDGLWVADGAVIPTALLVNPFLTISALAERTADHIHDSLDGNLEAPKVVPLVPAVRHPPPGLEFTEKMRGFITNKVTDAKSPEQFAAAAKIAKKDKTALEFRLTIVIDDLRIFLSEKEHVARTEGFIDSAMYGKRVLVEDGSFNLFIEDDDAHTKRMLYRLKFRAEDGQKYMLDGFKEIRDDPGFDVWQDTTTLFTSIRSGWDPDGPVVAQGIIHVLAADFLRQLTTFRVRAVDNIAARASWLGRFGSFFFGELWETYIRHQVPGVDA